MRDIDETDRQILGLLLDDARRSWREIADAVDLSPPAVSDRVERLEELGVVRGFTVDVDRTKLRGGTPVLVTVDVRPGTADALADDLTDADRVEHVFETADDVAEGIRSVTELPTYPMESPEPQHVAIMDYVEREDGARKRDLIDFGKEEGLPFIADRDAANRKSEYRLLDSHVLGPLSDNGYVELEDVGRSTRVSLTESGRNTLRAFRYLIEDN